MWMMLQQNEPDDYVISTGETHSVREFCELAFGSVGREYKEFVKIDPNTTAPPKSTCSSAIAARLRKIRLEAHHGFGDLVRLMVAEDLKLEGLDPKTVMVQGYTDGPHAH